MANGFDLENLVDNLPIEGIAQMLGVDASAVEQATAVALPELLQGLATNAATPGGAASLAEALGEHDGRGQVFVEDVDVEDGKKIVRHVLGNDPDSAAEALSAKAQGADQSVLAKLLPVVAPLLLGYLAGGYGKEKRRQPQTSNTSDLLGTLLGTLLGGGSTPQRGNLGGAGDLLGSILGQLGRR